MELKWKVVNTTIKAITKDERGNDTRKSMDKIGHPVMFKDGKNPIVIHAGQMKLITEMNTGIMALQRGGYVRIEKIEDMADALKDHVYKPETKVVPQMVGKAVEMGHDDYNQKSGQEYEGAVNPDGDPNFIVKAKRDNKNATKSSGGQKDGESSKVSPTIS